MKKHKKKNLMTWNRAPQSRVRAVGMSHLRGACGVPNARVRVMKVCMKHVAWDLVLRE